MEWPKPKKTKPKPPVSPKYIKIEPQTVASFPDDSLLVSGWILGKRRIRDKPTVLDVPYGKGKVILFGFNVHNRAQAFATMKLLFNAMYYWAILDHARGGCAFGAFTISNFGFLKTLFFVSKTLIEFEIQGNH